MVDNMNTLFLFQGGMFVVELIDQFTTSFPLLVVAFFEAISISWIYGE